MKKEAKTLHAKALDSLVVAIDHFNRVWSRGREEVVLILLNRAFELLLKAIIVHRDGDIHDKYKEGMTVGFDFCLRKCLSDEKFRCLSEDDVVALQTLNTLRDAAQHHMIEISEDHLYIYAQSAVTLFNRLSQDTLGKPLRGELPERVLPVCAKPPKNLPDLFDLEFADIKRLVTPGSRKRLDARAKLRSLAILQASLDGKKRQPTDRELNAIVRRINKDEDWREIFPGISTLTISQEHSGPGIVIRVTRNQGEAVQLVAGDDPNATVVAIKKINELDFYNLGARNLAQKLMITQHKLLWIIEKENIQSNSDYFKIIKIGNSKHKRYSGECLRRLRAVLEDDCIHGAYENRNNSLSGEVG